MNALAAATPKQLEVLHAYVHTGSIKAAAKHLGISQSAAAHHLVNLEHRTSLTRVQLCYLLGRGELDMDMTRRPYQPRPTGPTTLYRYFDVTGRLLYVGITEDPERRHKEHEPQPWYPSIARVEQQLYPTRRDAFTAERTAIVSERPAHNWPVKLPR